jgi:hypothetical protein
MVARDRAEVAIPSLAECLAAVAHNQVLLATGRYTHAPNKPTIQHTRALLEAQQLNCHEAQHDNTANAAAAAALTVSRISTKSLAAW